MEAVAASEVPDVLEKAEQQAHYQDWDPINSQLPSVMVVCTENQGDEVRMP